MFAISGPPVARAAGDAEGQTAPEEKSSARVCAEVGVMHVCAQQISSLCVHSDLLGRTGSRWTWHNDHRFRRSVSTEKPLSDGGFLLGRTCRMTCAKMLRLCSLLSNTLRIPSRRCSLPQLVGDLSRNQAARVPFVSWTPRVSTSLHT